MRNHRALAPARSPEPSAQPADPALLTLADQLAAAGLDTRSPAWEDRGYLKIINAPGTRTELTISTCGHLTWEYQPVHPSQKAPARLAAVILSLLDPAASHDITAEPCSDPTLVSFTGRALAACGLSVILDVLDVSQTSYEVYSELRITNPACPERGTASLAADGTVWWECRIDQTALSLADAACAITRALTTTTTRQPAR